MGLGHSVTRSFGHLGPLDESNAYWRFQPIGILKQICCLGTSPEADLMPRSLPSSRITARTPLRKQIAAQKAPQTDLVSGRLPTGEFHAREVPHRLISCQGGSSQANSYQGCSSQADFMPEMLPTGELHARRVPHEHVCCPGGLP